MTGTWAHRAGATPARLGAAAAIALAACAPAEGDPCEPHPDAPFAGERIVEETPCPFPALCFSEQRLYCVGPVGCGDDVVFHYAWVTFDHTLATSPVCGCDGNTYWPDTFDPRVRWQYNGYCDSCDEVYYEPTAGWFVRFPQFTLVRPGCTQCGDARTDSEGECVGADGSPRAMQCCRCSVQILDGREVCIGVTGEPVGDACCETP